jgi:hypothetical protein
MAHAALPQRMQHRSVRIAFDGVKHVAGKTADKISGGVDKCMRAQAEQWLGRAQGCDQVVDAGEGGGQQRAQFAHDRGTLQQEPLKIRAALRPNRGVRKIFFKAGDRPA